MGNAGHTAHHVAHHNHRGAGQPFAFDGGVQLAQRGDGMALVGQAGVLDDGHGRVGRQAGEQLLLDVGRAAYAHVDHQREPGLARGGGQLAPVGARVAGFGVAGDKHHAMRMLAVRERGAQRGQPRQPRRDAIDHRDRHPGGTQVLHFFTATAKDERVAALEAHHVLALAHGHEHQLFDEGLRRAGAATALAHVNDARRGRCVRHDGVAHQVIYQQHGGGLDGLEGLDGEQLGIARARAYQRAGSQVGGGRQCAGGGRGGVHGACGGVCAARCKMCSTCCASAGGTGRRPSSTSCV